jgi:DNA-directed RNA polymerase II subunit RPB11
MGIPSEDNVPSRFELFLLNDGEKKVVETPDTRMSFLPHLNCPRVRKLTVPKGIPSSSLFVFNKEDHTLGNLLRSRLLQSAHVTFAGYRVPHPLFR